MPMAFKRYFMPTAFSPDGAFGGYGLFSIIVAPIQGCVASYNHCYNSCARLGRYDVKGPYQLSRHKTTSQLDMSNVLCLMSTV